MIPSKLSGRGSKGPLSAAAKKPSPISQDSRLECRFPRPILRIPLNCDDAFAKSLVIELMPQNVLLGQNPRKIRKTRSSSSKPVAMIKAAMLPHTSLSAQNRAGGSLTFNSLQPAVVDRVSISDCTRPRHPCFETDLFSGLCNKNRLANLPVMGTPVQTVFLTGGAGFIGSAFIRVLLDESPSCHVTNFDALTYAGNMDNLVGLDDARHHFVKGDITDREAVLEALVPRCDVIINFAAESHVDRSIASADEFLRTNVLGTQVLLDCARAREVRRFVQVSTDEVMGTLAEN